MKSKALMLRQWRQISLTPSLRRTEERKVILGTGTGCVLQVAQPPSFAASWHVWHAEAHPDTVTFDCRWQMTHGSAHGGTWPVLSAAIRTSWRTGQARARHTASLSIRGAALLSLGQQIVEEVPKCVLSILCQC